MDGAIRPGKGRTAGQALPGVALAVVALVSLALLGAQVTVTRLLAYKFFYHFVFFVISLAQLGLAAAGAWIYARRSRSPLGTQLIYSLSALAVIPWIILATYAWASPAHNLSSKLDGFDSFPYLAALAVELVALNFAGGMGLTLLFSRYKPSIGKLYGADLGGAALGCVAALLAMSLLGPIRSFLLCGLLGVVALFLVFEFDIDAGGRSARRGSPWRRIAAIAVLLMLILPGLIRPQLFDPNIRHGANTGILRSEWNHLARTDAVAPSSYVIDGDASTTLKTASLSLYEPSAVTKRSAPYTLVRDRPSVAIIGVGAGPDLLKAMQHEARSVLAVDINTSILKWDLEDDRDANRGLFHQPSVTVRAGDGRHVVRSENQSFDLIVMHAIDTWTASSQGAYALSENFLYTVEAFGDFFDKLSPDGVMSVRRWLFYPPRENMRLFTTIHQALAERGISRPQDHMIAVAPTRNIRHPDLKVWGYVFFSPSAFTDEGLRGLDAFIAAREWSYLHRPGRSFETPLSEFANLSDKEEFYEWYPYFVRPARDENPFFFQFTPPWSGQKQTNAVSAATYSQSSTMLFLCLLICCVLTLALLGIPLFVRRKELSREPGLAGTSLYFGGLGLGFMAFELSAIQIMTLFLGHPTYALSVVLFGLLVFSGIGSFIMGRMPIRRIQPILCSIIALGLISALGLLELVHAGIHLSFAARVSITLAYLALIGIPLGMPFVAGIRLLDDSRPHQVAWAWSCNGASAVVGSCGLMIAMVFLGSYEVQLIGSASYAGALLISQRKLAAKANEELRETAMRTSDAERKEPELTVA